MDQNSTLEPWETEKDFVFGCRARPTSDTLVVSYDERRLKRLSVSADRPLRRQSRADHPVCCGPHRESQSTAQHLA